MFTCLSMFSHVYLCLALFFGACLPMFTHVFTYVYTCLPKFIPGYFCLPMFTHV